MDLRAFLARVDAERPADLVEVSRSVDPRFETAAIVAKLEARRRSPILVFRDVKGSAMPLVTNVCGSMGRLALALQCSLKEVAARYGAGARAPIEPVWVEDAPVQECVRRNDEVDHPVVGVRRGHDRGGEVRRVHIVGVIDDARQHRQIDLVVAPHTLLHRRVLDPDRL
ncbi:MAG: hypothetical protein AAF721_18430, partial [Myxococcota bacterium]